MKTSKAQNDELTQRTIAIIVKGGRIILKSNNGWYLSGWTNLAAGIDKASWGKKKSALEFFNLKLAYAIAPSYDCKVVVVYPKKK